MSEDVTHQSVQKAQCQWSYTNGISLFSAGSVSRTALIPSNTNQLYMSRLQLSVRIVIDGLKRILAGGIRYCLFRPADPVRLVLCGFFTAGDATPLVSIFGFERCRSHVVSFSDDE